MKNQLIKILLVEDSPEDVIFIEEALGDFKDLQLIYRAEDGRQALSFLKKEGEFKKAASPDLVLLDLNLPMMDGQEVLRKIKSDEALGDIKVVILTTSVTEEIQKACYDLKADLFVTKPRDYHLYNEIFSEIKGLVYNTAPAHPITEEPNPEIEIKVLLIEDNPDDIVLMQQLLVSARKYTPEHTRFTLDTAVTAKDALNLLNKTDYDVVLLDMTLPDSHGMDTIDKFESFFYSTPFIVMSGFNDKKLALKSIKRGIQEYLVKGKVNSELFITTLNHSIERHRMMTMIRSLALYDELTRLYNRRGFFHLLEHQIRIANRKKKSFPLLYLDLDKFKIINDTLGHQTGDKALKEVAEILKETFRNSDIIARLGGDEFAVFPYETEQEDEEVIKKRLETSIARFNNQGERQYTISMSIGIARYEPENPCSIDNLISRADHDMYINKKNKSS